MDIVEQLRQMKIADQPRIEAEQNRGLQRRPKTDAEIKRAYVGSLMGGRRWVMKK